MSKKPSFANLSSRLAQKPTEVSEPALMEQTRAAAVVSVGTDASILRTRQPDGRRGILVRARPEAWKALKQVALDGERTLQDVMTEAINDVLIKNGKTPLA